MGHSSHNGINPYTHIRSYVSGSFLASLEAQLIHAPYNSNNDNPVPPYVGSDCYCETAQNSNQCCMSHLYFNDTLWDGQQCVAVKATCCTHPKMPRFNKTPMQ